MRFFCLTLLCLIILLGATLRLYQLGTTPHGLYFDEASIGYNALLIGNKGVDEHGVSYPLWFAAFGEYKMPVYIYLTALAVKLLGPTTIAVRITSALFGTLTILSFFFLVRELAGRSSLPYKKALPYVCAFLLAISTWHIQFSHAGFEATVAAFFYLTGLLLALLYWRKRSLPFLILSLVCFGLTLYTYDGYRPLTPLTLLILGGYAFWVERKLRKTLLGALLVVVLALAPLVLFNLTPEGLARFSQVSAFNELAHLPFWQRLLFMPAYYLRNYLTYFSFWLSLWQWRRDCKTPAGRVWSAAVLAAAGIAYRHRYAPENKENNAYVLYFFPLPSCPTCCCTHTSQPSYPPLPAYGLSNVYHLCSWLSDYAADTAKLSCVHRTRPLAHKL